mmetsp:Transcript_75327/g.151455  ORF Transcript_75327/g.151455 Transcript_75327/m.151455 type:complete len:124 (+) Transcript_75327:35-406(+)
MFRQLVTRSVQRGARPRFFAAQGKEAYLFGVKPGTYQYEGWEGIVYTTYAASALLLTVGLYSRPGIDIKTWAADEAAARKAVKEQGGEVRCFSTGFPVAVTVRQDMISLYFCSVVYVCLCPLP